MFCSALEKYDVAPAFPVRLSWFDGVAGEGEADAAVEQHETLARYSTKVQRLASNATVHLHNNGW